MATIWEETKIQTSKMKGRPFKEKLAYFWEYYKTHTIIAVCSLAMLFSIIHAVATSKDYALSVVILNSIADSLENEEGMALTKVWVADLTTILDFDTKKYEVAIDATMNLGGKTNTANAEYATAQKLAALMSAKTLDIMISDNPTFEQYAQNEYYYDLRDLYSSEELARYSDIIYYTDAATFSDYEDETNLDVSDDQAAYIVNHHDPSSMSDPIPVGFFITESSKPGSVGIYSYLTPEDTFQGYPDEAVLGVPINTPRVENTLIAIDYFLN